MIMPITCAGAIAVAGLGGVETEDETENQPGDDKNHQRQECQQNTDLAQEHPAGGFPVVRRPLLVLRHHGGQPLCHSA